MTTMDDTQTIDADALRARLAEMAQRARDEMGAVADEDPRAEVARLRALLEVAQTSLAAATSGRRVTACDEIDRLQRERDAATDLLAEVWHEIATGRPPSVSDRTAWLAQMHDVVGEASYCAALVAARDTLTRERDALRDAAREYLDARHNGLVALDAYLDADPADAAARDAVSADEARVTATRTRLAALVGDDATMRRDLPAVAVVVCPACGYGCTADLGDGAYVLRPHSRRETARVGLGGIVWCDGGTVRAR